MNPVGFRRRWLRTLVSVAAIFIGYYAIPVRQHGFALAVGMTVVLAALALLGWGIAGQLRHHLVHGEPVGLPALITMLSGVVVVFSLGYYRLELTSPGQMADLETRTDSLYFTMQVLTTVGLGDVSAQGQLARGLALVQMVFDVVFVAAAGSLLAGSVRESLRQGKEHPPPRTSGEEP